MTGAVPRSRSHKSSIPQQRLGNLFTLPLTVLKSQSKVTAPAPPSINPARVLTPEGPVCPNSFIQKHVQEHPGPPRQQQRTHTGKKNAKAGRASAVALRHPCHGLKSVRTDRGVKPAPEPTLHPYPFRDRDVSSLGQKGKIEQNVQGQKSARARARGERAVCPPGLAHGRSPAD